MGQPTYIGKIDGSSTSAHSLTLTRTTTGGNMILVGVVLNANGAESPQQVAGIIDSAGTPTVLGVSTGVPVNTWAQLGASNDDGIRMEWWVCKSAVSISYLTIDITGTGATGLQSIGATALEYNTANGISNPNFQALQSNQNTITTQYILETVATYPNSGAALMIGLFAMLNDTFSATPPSPASALQTVRSTQTVSIPPSLSWQVIEQATFASAPAVIDIAGERVVLAVDALNVTAESATQLATAANVSASSMQCLYLVISGGLILNTPPGFSDQPDSSLAAGQYALGSQLAKISGNAALGMCRLEFFQGIYGNGETVELPISPVDGYQYQNSECTFVWGIYSTGNANGWITGPQALWYCFWNVDQETGLVSSTEWYNTVSSDGTSNDGFLQVSTIAQRQQLTLTAGITPTWTQQQASDFVTDLAYSTDVLTAMNENSKFAVLGQECISMGEFYNGLTVPRPVSPADGYEYAYSEVTFLFSWRWTTYQNNPIPLPALNIDGYGNLASLNAAIDASTGVVTCAVGMMKAGGEGYTSYTTLGQIAVFALCQRARTGTPAVVANEFAEISNTLFYPGSDAFAYLGGQVVKNIQEAALTPEFFGPTLYALGATIPAPTSPIDGYAYSRAELTYIFEWGEMTPGPWPPNSGSNNRTALFSAQINPLTGVITNTVSGSTYTSVIWRLEPGGPYDPETTNGFLSVVVVGSRSAQQTEINQFGSTPPSDSGSTTADQVPAGPITINGV